MLNYLSLISFFLCLPHAVVQREVRVDYGQAWTGPPGQGRRTLVDEVRRPHTRHRWRLP